MKESRSDPQDSVTEVADESFVRERPTEIERGTVLAGRYQVEDIIGKGGSGVVLRVFDRTAQSVVALKVLKAELARDAKWEKRFSRELRLGRPIQHANVCRIFDIGEADGHRFLTMELAVGGSLRDELKRARSADRPIERRLEDARAVIGGLAALHAAGVVHRDFKPDNILRMGDGRLVLSDFGLATDAANAPGATVLIGTPHYMAPEVLAGEPATSRSDVWALGVVLHEIFFGQRPERRSVSFDGSNRSPLRPRSAVERAALALCELCLADVALERPADAGVVATMFESARPAGRRIWGRRRGAAAALIATLVLGLATERRLRQHFQRGGRLDASVTPVRLAPRGSPADWSKTAKIVADIPDRVHCFSVLNGRTARVVWGTPRHAEDIDTASGQRRPANLLPETYRSGCPDMSQDGHSLLFVAQNHAGASEVRLSTRVDGADARTVTSGSDPLWLGSTDEFVYDVDSSHVGIFSLPTMTMSLLPDPGVGERRMIVDKAVRRTGNSIATLVCDESSQYAVTVYSGETFASKKTFIVPGKYRLQFGDDSDSLYLSVQLAGPKSALAMLDWHDGTLLEEGRYPGFDIMWARVANGSELSATLLGRRTSTDVWAYDGEKRKRLTFDGQNFSAARFPSGDLLLSKRGDDGRLAIWLRGSDGIEKQVTFGDRDVQPGVAPNGHWWAYADYASKSLIMCSLNGDCHVLRRDDLPCWPSFSPDGVNLAYLTQLGVQRMKIISAATGDVKASWDAYASCPPVWSSPTTLWGLEVSEGRYFWFEREIVSGTRTGKSLQVQTDNAVLGDVECWPSSVPKNSALFQRLRVETEETSRLMSLGLGLRGG
jgi:hypothetical protein